MDLVLNGLIWQWMDRFGYGGMALGWIWDGKGKESLGEIETWGPTRGVGNSHQLGPFGGI